MCEAPSALLMARCEDPAFSESRNEIEKELMRRKTSQKDCRAVRQKRVEDKRLKQMETARFHDLYSGDPRKIKSWK